MQDSFSEIFHQSGLLKAIKFTGVASYHDLGTCTGRIIIGRMLGYMRIIDPSKVTVLETDVKESEIISDLMVDFLYISKEDPPYVLAANVYQHYQDTRDVIAYNHIPPKLNVPLEIARKRRTKEEFDDENFKKSLKSIRRLRKLKCLNQLLLTFKKK